MRNDALSVVSKLAASSNNVFTRQQAAQVGLSDKSIRSLKASGILIEPHRGVLVVCNGSEPSWELRLRAALLGRSAWASARSAARVHKIDGFTSACELEVVTMATVRYRLEGIQITRSSTLSAQDVVVADGIAVTNLARTLVDLGDVASCDELERAFDDVVRSGANPRWIRDTARRTTIAGQRGSRRVLGLLDAFERRGKVRDSWFEAMIEKALAHPELVGCVIQHSVRDDQGTEIARFDLAIPDARLGIEGHSRKHHFGAVNEASDEFRDDEVSALGWDVMYLGYAESQSPVQALQRVLRRVRTRREQLGRGGRR